MNAVSKKGEKRGIYCVSEQLFVCEHCEQRRLYVQYVNEVINYACFLVNFGSIITYICGTVVVPLILTKRAFGFMHISRM